MLVNMRKKRLALTNDEDVTTDRILISRSVRATAFQVAQLALLLAIVFMVGFCSYRVSRAIFADISATAVGRIDLSLKEISAQQGRLQDELDAMRKRLLFLEELQRRLEISKACNGKAEDEVSPLTR